MNTVGMQKKNILQKAGKDYVIFVSSGNLNSSALPQTTASSKNRTRWKFARNRGKLAD
jgi:hypothetical protein